ncbi:MAG TPA: ribosome maturation factor RimM [Acidimicrobiales bacterium]
MGDAGSAGSPPLLEVGYIARAHGLRGEVVVVLITDRAERVSPGVVLSSDAGDLTVAASRPHQDRWIVTFAGHGTREQADALRGLALRAAPLDDPAELWVHDVVGSTVRTAAGDTVGRCVAVVANPAADLIELDTGALVPVTFVVDHAPGTLTVDPPDGLFDL